MGMLLLLLLVVAMVAGEAGAQGGACMKSVGVAANARVFSSCQALQQLEANLAWTYSAEEGTVDVAFTATPDTSSGWVAWGLNPTAAAMGGTRSLIAFKHANGTLIVATYNVTDASKGAAPLEPSPIDYKLSNLAADFSGGKLTMFGRWTLQSNKTNVYHVWQTGAAVEGVVPQTHGFAAANLQAKGSIDLKTGAATASTAIPNMRLKNRHGVLNVVGWSILLPIGIMFARYLRSVEVADPAWFYLHSFCQISGFVIGVVGWATGLKLGSDSKGVVYSIHRNLGIAIFAFCTVQISAVLIRPKKDHKYRIYWNIYHHSVGYTIIVMSIINIFKGFDILQPEEKWKHAYIVVIASLGGIALFAEIISWIAFFQRKADTSSKPSGNV